MNLAILIGQSDYKTIQKLPGCINDLRLTQSIIKETGKYEKILVLDDSINRSEEAKRQIMNFVEENQENNVDELFFYYTGHGHYDGNDFFYLWKDYDNKIKRQTSIENTEIDAYLRKLNPALCVKVIDSCNSGVAYVKEAENIDTYLKGTKDGFRNCYFMFSSQANQNSSAGISISDFTLSFINSLHRSENYTIRYKEIIDYISDSFEANPLQTPQFIVQASLKEIFCTINTQILDLINSKYQVPINADLGDYDILLEKIKNDAKRYSYTEEQIVSLLNNIESIINENSNKHYLKSLYEIKLTKQPSSHNIPKPASIGSYIKEKTKGLFTEIIYKKESYQTRELRNPIRINIFSDPDDDTQYKTVIRYRSVAENVSSAINFGFSHYEIELIPKYPNLQKYGFIYFPLVSKTTLYIFYIKFFYEEYKWNQFQPKYRESDWQVFSADFSDEKIETTIFQNIEKSFDLLKDEIGKQYSGQSSPPE
ncbi:caspase family protein [Leptospira wolffii]|uniref:caspase family protein n=1 Tax=Leptospira wolffii TaxID=409998 RepID=UPI0003041093|nr:caspase family protein [Leptospira wolffii]EPG66442.1 caspase domain protein [Leptospira wolffii serovar Khorat str. Khorat-H2]